MTQQIENLHKLYKESLVAAKGEYQFTYDDEHEREIVKAFNEIYIDCRKNHRDKVDVKVSQGSNTITFIKKTDAKVEVEDTPVVPKAEEVEVVEPKKWPTPAVDLTLENPKRVEDCETPEDCEDECKGDCIEGFEGDNLT